MKYLIIILLSFFGLSASAQLMQTNGTAGGYQWVASKSDSLHIIPRGSDTPAIGGTKYGKSTVAAMFYKTTDSTLWIRSSNKWNQVTGSGGSIVWGDITGDITNQIDLINYVDSVIVANGGTDSLYYRGGAAVDSFFYSKNGVEYFWYANPATDRIIYGGIVTWTGTDLDYYVSACYFRKNGIYYLTNDTTVTLPALADADSSRTDVFIVQTLSDTQAQTTTITGTESANPITPQVDGNTDLYLTHITLNPNQTTGLTDTLIVYDNLSAGEFEYRSSTGVTTNFSNTTNVYRVPYSANVSAINNNDIIGFGTETQRNALNYLGLSFFIKLKTVMPNSNGMLVSLWNNGVQVSNEIGIPFNRTNLNYQGFSVPMTTFGMTNAYFDSVRFRYAGGGAGISGMYFDFIYFQGNMNPGGPSTGGNNKWVTQGAAITIDSVSIPNVYKISADTNTLATQYYVDNSVSASGVDSIVVNSPLSIDFTNRQIPVISYTGDTTRYFVFESPIQATDLGDTVYVYLDSTGNGDYSVAHHSFGYYLGVFLTESQASIKYISYDSAIGKFMDTAYVSNDTLYGAKNGTEFPIGTIGGGSGSGISQVVADWGLININDSTLKVDSFLVASRARVDKVADSLGVIIATKLSANQAITVTATGDATGTSSASGTAPSLPLTLATVNSNVGTFTNATVTVNGKGLITAASSGTAGTSLNGTGYVKMSGTTPSYQSNTQLTADVNTFTQTLSGAVPAPTTLNGYFLKDNGTWAAASGGSSGVNYVAADSAFVGSVSGVGSNGTDGGSTSPNYNILIGNLNGQGMGAGVENISLGHGAMQNANPSYGVGIGYQAMQNSTAHYGIGIGYRALLNAQPSVAGTSNDNFIAIGPNALATFTTNSGGASGGSNTAIGREALEGLTTGSGNFAFGLRSLESLTNGNNNIMLGDFAGYNFVSGLRNVGIGVSALRGNTGNDNIAIGTNAGFHSAATGSGNIFIQSSNSIYSSRTSAANNTIIGAGGVALTSGGNNLMLISGFGEATVTSGSGNLLFGDRPVVPLNTGSNQIVMAVSAFNVLLSDYDGARRKWVLTGDHADPVATTTSATLHITGTGGGLLIPALTSTQRNAVSTPASGLQVVNTTLQNSVNVYNGTAWVNTNQQVGNEAITANKTITATTGTHLHMVDATAGNITITLPTMAAGYVGVEYQFIRTDGSANTVTVTRAGSNTINNAATSFTIAQFERAYVIGVNNSNTFTWHAGKFTNY